MKNTVVTCFTSLIFNLAFKLASLDENNEFEGKKRKKHKKDKYEGNELNDKLSTFRV